MLQMMYSYLITVVCLKLWLRYFLNEPFMISSICCSFLLFFIFFQPSNSLQHLFTLLFSLFCTLPLQTMSQDLISCICLLISSLSPLCTTSCKTKLTHFFNGMHVDGVRRPRVSVCILVCPCISSFNVGGCEVAAGSGSRTMVCLNGISIVPQSSCPPS